jgi:anti-anti-sigma regulatory factor
VRETPRGALIASFHSLEQKKGGSRQKFSCLATGGLGRFASIVSFDDKPPTLRCRGDEDRNTQGFRRRALTRAIRAQADVFVDLSELAFADVSLMLDLAMLARRLRTHGGAIRLHGAQPQIRRLIEHVGLHKLPGVQLDGPTPALA